MLNEPMIFADMYLENVLLKAVVWLSTSADSYTVTHCLVTYDEDELSGWKVEIFYRMDD